MELIDKIFEVWNLNGDLLRDDKSDYSHPVYRCLIKANFALSEAIAFHFCEARKTQNTKKEKINSNQQTHEAIALLDNSKKLLSCEMLDFEYDQVLENLNAVIVLLQAKDKVCPKCTEGEIKYYSKGRISGTGVCPVCGGKEEM